MLGSEDESILSMMDICLTSEDQNCDFMIEKFMCIIMKGDIGFDRYTKEKMENAVSYFIKTYNSG